ncbi:MAG: glycosyl transferase family 1 [Crocinitomicaceae bacterium]|nr:glycosyl transferase family 1 [Crocinitomicaceae bacterium]
MEKGARLVVQMNVLILNPYHTGSHEHWAKGMQKHLSEIKGTKVELWTMPGRHWKWRMHGASGEFAHRATVDSPQPDLIITTDMLDAASFKGLLPQSWRLIPLVQYFHENQLTFPWSDRDAEKARGLNHTYEFMNIQSAAAADWIWFNSSYHREVFVEASARFIKRMPDFKGAYSARALAEKSSILPVGIPTPHALDLERSVGTPPTILWNHRWEYDKGPDQFLENLNALAEDGHDFRLVLCGEQYTDVHPVLECIRNRFKDRILHDGFAPARDAYDRLLRISDFVIHEPVQEYFGVSVAEAMSFGVIPLLKADQAYPNWVPGAFLYKHTEQMLSKWVQWKTDTVRGRKLANKAVSEYYWPQVAGLAHRELRQRFGLR